MIEGLAVFVVLIAVVALCLGLFLFFSEGRNKQRVLFALLNLFAAIWILSNYFGSNTLNALTKSFVLTDYISGAILALLFWLFIIETKRKILKRTDIDRLVQTVAAIATTAVVMLILSGYVVHVEVDTQLRISNGSLYLVYPVGVLILALMGMKDLIVTTVKARSAADKTKLRLMIIGIATALVCISVPNLILQNIFAKDSLLVISYNSAYVGVLLFLTLSTYAIIRHGLFDIKAAAVRSAAYALSIVTLAATYYAVAYFVSVTLFQGEVSSTVSISPINILLALVLAFIFQPIKSFFDKITNKIFYRDRYKTDVFYAQLSELLTTTTDLKEMLEQAADKIQQTLKTQHAFFVIAEGRDKYASFGAHRRNRFPAEDIHDINVYVERHGEVTIMTSLVEDDRHVRRILTSHKVEVVMPLVRYGAIIGYLMLGEQLGSGFTSRDIRVLGTISDELIIAIQHALAVQEVKNINENLEQRIEAATAELRTSNARLKRLDTSKDEFLSMASHQLRTPLTSIKGYLSMMLEGDVGKVTPMQKKVLEEAFTSSERMVHLIHDFLNVSRLQTGKFMLELQEVDLVKLVSAEVKSLERVAESRSMTLKFTSKAKSIPMTLDDTKIRQVVMNYIDNAIYYSKPDTTILVDLSKTDDSVTLKVTDTGIGVPSGEQDQLFGKFFRATNARKQRPDGTGVGLYLAKKVITALGGEIVFESKVGKGSTFGFQLPLGQDEKKLQDNAKQLVDHPAE